MPPGVCAVAVNVIFVVGRGIEGLRFDCGSGGSKVGVSLSCVTFEPRRLLLWAWHGVKGEAMAVNEAEHTGIVWKVLREERLQKCELGVTVVRWCSSCHTHTGNEMSS